MAVGKSEEAKQKIIAAWNSAEAQGVSMAKWVESVKGNPELEVSVGSLRNWLGLNSSRSSSSGASKASSSTTYALAQEFEAKFEADKKAAYVKFLEGKAKDLEAQLAAIEGEITKLTSDPVVAD